MIKVNGDIVGNNHFPDNTLALRQHKSSSSYRITWNYENDSELFSIICLAKHLKDATCILEMPYCPHARMDRVENSEDVFTLKYFCEVINSLNFAQVIITDPHSNVCIALLNNVKVINATEFIQEALSNIVVKETGEIGHEYRMECYKNLVMFYPDEGAMKRYSKMSELPYSFGIKNRDWKTGKILGLDIMNKELVKDKNVLIVDDICSRGGTFTHSAKTLKEAGVKNIYLYITHCENTIEKGSILTDGLVNHIYTTNSIYTGSNEKITIL